MLQAGHSRGYSPQAPIQPWTFEGYAGDGSGWLRVAAFWAEGCRAHSMACRAHPGRDEREGSPGKRCSVWDMGLSVFRNDFSATVAHEAASSFLSRSRYLAIGFALLWHALDAEVSSPSFSKASIHCSCFYCAYCCIQVSFYCIPRKGPSCPFLCRLLVQRMIHLCSGSFPPLAIAAGS